MSNKPKAKMWGYCIGMNCFLKLKNSSIDHSHVSNDIAAFLHKVLQMCNFKSTQCDDVQRLHILFQLSSVIEHRTWLWRRRFDSCSGIVNFIKSCVFFKWFYSFGFFFFPEFCLCVCVCVCLFDDIFFFSQNRNSFLCVFRNAYKKKIVYKKTSTKPHFCKSLVNAKLRKYKFNACGNGSSKNLKEIKPYNACCKGYKICIKFVCEFAEIFAGIKYCAMSILLNKCQQTKNNIVGFAWFMKFCKVICECCFLPRRPSFPFYFCVTLTL